MNNHDKFMQQLCIDTDSREFSREFSVNRFYMQNTDTYKWMHYE